MGPPRLPRFGCGYIYIYVYHISTTNPTYPLIHFSRLIPTTYVSWGPCISYRSCNYPAVSLYFHNMLLPFMFHSSITLHHWTLRLVTPIPHFQRLPVAAAPALHPSAPRREVLVHLGPSQPGSVQAELREEPQCSTASSHKIIHAVKSVGAPRPPPHK